MPGLGFVTKPRRDIGYRSNGGVIEAPLKADSTQRGKSVRDPNAETNVVPKLSRVALFFNSLNPFHVVSMRQASAVAPTLGITLQPHYIRTSDDLDGAFAAIRKERPDALFILADRVFLHNRQRLMDFAKEQRLPSVNAYEELVEAGGLMSYGPSYEDMHRRAAIYVDKILKGAKPGNLPIEQPTKFTFIINLKSAKALGLTVPPLVLGLADRLIE